MPIQKITSGIIQDGAVAAADIVSVSNTAISGTITGSQISSNTLSNTVFQTGSVENYMNAAGLGFGMRNRIINGDMRIDQRNAGASVTPTNNQYLVDRFLATLTQASKFTVQQNAGAITPPVGFTKYLGVTSSSAYSILTGDTFAIAQYIEGFNVADLAYGTASAATVTLSFQVRSSLTGTFGGAFVNNAQDRSYPFTYTIFAANTWESKSITIAGDTTGTWATDNSVGLGIRFGLGSGATYTGTAGAWAAGNFLSATGATSVVGTNGATFYITGVQLEKGSTATSFDYRPYGTEFQLCQRYYEKSYDPAVVPGTASTTNGISYQYTGRSLPQGYGIFRTQLRVDKRTIPTVVIYTSNGTAGQFVNTDSGTDIGAVSLVHTSPTGFLPINNTNTTVAAAAVGWHYTASAEL